MASSVDVSAIVEDWKKKSKQELRDALASRGLDTNGLRPSLIHRLECSRKATAHAAIACADSENPNPNSEPKPSSRESNANPSTAAPKKDMDTEMTSEREITKDGDTEMPSKGNPISRDPQATVKVKDKEKRKEFNGCFTDLEKKQMRAERFGLELLVSEEEKRKLRASRFSDIEVKKNRVPESEKRMQRAARFGDIEPKKNRVPESEKRKQRAARFGAVDDESTKKAQQLRAGELTESVKRQARAARFGIAM